MSRQGLQIRIVSLGLSLVLTHQVFILVGQLHMTITVSSVRKLRDISAGGAHLVTVPELGRSRRSVAFPLFLLRILLCIRIGGHLSLPLKNLHLRGSLDEVHLEERLEVEVSHLILVRNAQELGQRGVREDAALERRVEAAVLLDVARDELRDLRLRALLTRLETHERRQLIRERALDQEGVVGAASLPRLALLRGHLRRVLLLLLLDLAGLALGRLDGIRNALRGLANTGRELRGQRLELLSQASQDHIRALRSLGNRRGRRRINRRDRHNGLGRHNRLLSLDSLGLGDLDRGSRRRSGNRGGDGDRLRGIGLLSGHLVCLNGGRRRGHF